MEYTFTTKNGEQLRGKIVHQYGAFANGMRYVLETETGAQFRCVKDSEGNFVELVI